MSDNPMKIPDANTHPVDPLPLLTHLEMNSKETQMTLEGGAIGLVADALVKQFYDSGAINYLELTFTHETVGSFVLTMQKATGVTPADRIEKMKALILDGKIDEALSV